MFTAPTTLTCSKCGAPVSQDGEKIARSCECPADTTVTANCASALYGYGGLGVRPQQPAA